MSSEIPTRFSVRLQENKKRKRTKSEIEIDDLKKERDDLKEELDKYHKYTKDMVVNPVANLIYFILILLFNEIFRLSQDTSNHLNSISFFSRTVKNSTPKRKLIKIDLNLRNAFIPFLYG